MNKKQYISFFVIALFVLGTFLLFQEPMDESSPNPNEEVTIFAEEIENLENKIVTLKSEVEEIRKENVDLHHYLEEALESLYIYEKDIGILLDTGSLLAYYEDNYLLKSEYLSIQEQNYDEGEYGIMHVWEGDNEVELSKIKEVVSSENVVTLASWEGFTNRQRILFRIEETPAFVVEGRNGYIGSTNVLNELPEILKDK